MATMQEIRDYTRTDTAWSVQEGFVPVIEVQGRDSSGKLFFGHEQIGRSGFYSRKDDAVAVARQTLIKAVVLDGSDLRIRV